MDRAAPRWLVWTGIAAVGLAGGLAVRLVWEQTIWTWEHGPAMVGHALAHTRPGLLLVDAVAASLAWPLMALLVAVVRHRIPDRKLLALLTAYGLAWLLMLVPYGTWQRLFIDRFSQAQAIALLDEAAGEGDVRTVMAVLESGVAVDAQGPTGTALHAAAAEGQLEVMAYLISRGADVNATDAHGVSPMVSAQHARTRSMQAQRLLADHGGILRYRPSGNQAGPAAQ